MATETKAADGDYIEVRGRRFSKRALEVIKNQHAAGESLGSLAKSVGGGCTAADLTAALKALASTLLDV